MERMASMEICTVHGMERMKERVGLRERRAVRMVELAKERGKRYEDCRWSVDRKYLQKSTDDNAEAIAYNGFCYIISKTDGRLITAYRLPKDFDVRKTRYNSYKEGKLW